MNRTTIAVVAAHTQLEGGGFEVKRPFPGRLPHFDPFLLLDEMGPVTYAPGEAVGAPDHPHRGFQTVTMLLDGELEHADSAGHAGTLRAGDVQWMSAGAGVVHREMPSVRVQQQGGRVHGFQLWVNLPASEKGTAPRYTELAADTIPTWSSPDGKASARLVAGDVFGITAPVQPRHPVTVQRWTLSAGARVTVPTPADHRVGVYVFAGSVTVGGTVVPAGSLAITSDAGDALELAADGDAQALLLGGRPIGEPIAWGGPFVMNTREEVLKAFDDYRGGRMGAIPPEIVRA